MIKRRGQNKYVPKIVLDEIDLIKKEDFGKDVPYDVYAFVKLVKYAQVGREIERKKDFNYTPVKKRKGALQW